MPAAGPLVPRSEPFVGAGCGQGGPLIRQRLAGHRLARGFTLLELMLTLTILAVLTAGGIASFRFVTNSNRVASEANALLGDMSYARAQAIKEGRTVTICTSANGSTCAGTSTWQSGWIVFSDANGNQAVDAGEAVRRVQRPLNLGDTFVASPATAAVTFSREGFAMGLPGTVMV